MRNFSVLILVSVLFFTSCKKKDKTPEPASNNSTTGSTTVYYPTLTPSTGGDMCGLQTTYRYFDHNGTVTKTVWCLLHFMQHL